MWPTNGHLEDTGSGPDTRLCSVLLCGVVSVAWYGAVSRWEVLCSVEQFYAVECSVVLYSDVQFCTVLVRLIQ